MAVDLYVFDNKLQKFSQESNIYFYIYLETIGAYVASGKWIRGYGTKFVWNSVKSTLSAPSKRNEAVIDDTTCAIKRFKLV